MRNDAYGSLKILAIVIAVFCAVLIIAMSCGDDGGNPAGSSSGDGTSGPIDTLITGGSLWMAKNLNIAVDSSWCYNNDVSNCAAYGRLYTWKAAQVACSLLGESWRLPSRADWDALIDSAGGWDIAGRKLKAFTGWGNDNVIDSLDSLYLVLDSLDSMQLFMALPGGYRLPNETFEHIGLYGYWWSSDEHLTEGGSGKNMEYNNSRVFQNYVDKRRGYSVRCVRDAPPDTTR